MSTTTEPDCGSSSCMFSAKGGMRTNGPCRCMENAGFHGSAVMAAKQMLREVLLLRARLDAMPHDRTWTKDKPTPGEWWVSIAPGRRPRDLPPVIRCRIYNSHQTGGRGDPRVKISYENYRALALSNFMALDEPAFISAQWRPVEETPADPFAEPPRSYSQDNDLP